MASGIAATYGYSVAGGIPGGLIAEYVMRNSGRMAVAELSPLIGEAASKAIVGFALFAVMGAYLELFAICAYAFAHQVPREASQQSPPGSPKVPFGNQSGAWTRSPCDVMCGAHANGSSEPAVGTAPAAAAAAHLHKE